MQSSIDDVRQTFGTPNQEHKANEYTSLFYKDVGLGFDFDGEGSLTQVQVHAESD